MLTLFLGPKNCGKSLAAERCCARRHARTTYLATLPDLAAFRDRIEAHKRQRPPAWSTRYLALPAPNLTHELHAAAAASPGLLLDGFSAILKVQYCFFGADAAAMAHLTDDIFGIVDRSAAGTDWVVVDHQPVPQHAALPAPLRWAIARAHAGLLERCGSIHRHAAASTEDA
jgi:adenosyl cobinamide kinase/adenosyl cobinamide phosphate guanylyltransferase